MKKFFQRNHQKIIIFFALAVIFLSLAMPNPAKAIDNPIDCLIGFISFPLKLALGFAVLITILAVAIIQAVSGILPFIGGVLLSWLINLPITLTHGGFVDTGWQLSRDIANMFFIVILLVIAFATMLKLEIYAAKKTLVTFIIIALLINFSQVIAGVIIDITNIVMNFFRDAATNATSIFINQNIAYEFFKNQGPDTLLGLARDLLDICKTPMYIIGQLLMVIITGITGVLFNIFSFLILLLYGVVLTLRIVMIWILVILAPLAWLGRILPATKGWWNSWWKSFFQWAVVGIPLLFFLWLTGLVLANPTCPADWNTNALGNALQKGDGGIMASFLATFYNTLGELACPILKFIFAIMMMIMGLMLGISASMGAPGMAQGIIQKPFKMGMETGKWAAMGAALGAGTKGGTRESYAQRAMGRLSKIPWVGLPVSNVLQMQMAQARAKAGAGLETRTNEDLGNLIGHYDASGKFIERKDVNGFTKSKVTEILLDRLNRGMATWGEVIKHTTFQTALAAKRLGALNTGILAKRNLLEFSQLIDKNPEEIVKVMSLNDYINMRIKDMKDKDKTAFTNKIFNITGAAQMGATLNGDSPEDVKALAESVDDAIRNTPLVAKLAAINNTAAGGTGEVGAGRMASLIQSKPIAEQGKLKNEIRDVIFNYFKQNKPAGLTEEHEIRRYSDMMLEGLVNRNALVTKGV